MKHIKIFLLLIVMSVAAWAQDTDFSKRDITLRINNKRGRPVKNIIVKSFSANKAGITDRKGLFVFGDMSDNDTISIMLPKYGETIIPVTGLDSIVVILRSARLYSYSNTEGQSIYIEREKNEYINREKTAPSTILDVPAIMRERNYNSLADLLQERAGLAITSKGVSIGGERSLLSSNEPLMVMNGMPMGTFSEANTLVNLYDIKTIEVLRNAPEWGSRGANGVILIVTK